MSRSDDDEQKLDKAAKELRTRRRQWLDARKAGNVQRAALLRSRYKQARARYQALKKRQEAQQKGKED